MITLYNNYRRQGRRDTITRKAFFVTIRCKVLLWHKHFTKSTSYRIIMPMNDEQFPPEDPMEKPEPHNSDSHSQYHPEQMPQPQPETSAPQYSLSPFGKFVVASGLTIAAFNIGRGVWESTDTDNPQPFVEHTVSEIVFFNDHGELTPAERGLSDLAWLGMVAVVIEGGNMVQRKIARHQAGKAAEEKRFKNEDDF
jgi:hypothetical protein